MSYRGGNAFALFGWIIDPFIESIFFTMLEHFTKSVKSEEILGMLGRRSVLQQKSVRDSSEFHQGSFRGRCIPKKIAAVRCCCCCGLVR